MYYFYANRHLCRFTRGTLKHRSHLSLGKKGKASSNGFRSDFHIAFKPFKYYAHYRASEQRYYNFKVRVRHNRGASARFGCRVKHLAETGISKSRNRLSTLEIVSIYFLLSSRCVEITSGITIITLLSHNFFARTPARII